MITNSKDEFEFLNSKLWLDYTQNAYRSLDEIRYSGHSILKDDIFNYYHNAKKLIWANWRSSCSNLMLTFSQMIYSLKNLTYLEMWWINDEMLTMLFSNSLPNLKVLNCLNGELNKDSWFIIIEKILCNEFKFESGNIPIPKELLKTLNTNQLLTRFNRHNWMLLELVSFKFKFMFSK